MCIYVIITVEYRLNLGGLSYMAGSRDKENKVPPPPSGNKTPLHTSTAALMQHTNPHDLPLPPPATDPPLTVAMISWNMANRYGGDIYKLIRAMRSERGDLPDIIVIAGQEEGRDEQLSLGTQLKIKLGDHRAIYNQSSASFTTRTKPTEPGRVSLTVLSRNTVPPPQIRFETYQGVGVKASNKGGVGCHMTVGDKKLTFAGMHFDSNYDDCKIQAANAMVKKLEGFTDTNKYLSYEMMKANSADVDVMMGDFNYRHVKSGSSGKHYDPVSRENFNSSSARGLTGFGFSPVPPQKVNEEGLAPNTYNKAKDKGHLLISSNKKHKRCDGRTREPCFAEGNLDVISRTATSQATLTPVLVVDTDEKLSDHQPVVSIMTLESEEQTDFERTKKWVSRKIKPYASEEVIATLMDFEDDAVGQSRLEAVYNYYMNIRNLVIQAELFGLHPQRGSKEYEVCRVLMGERTDASLDDRESFQASIAGYNTTNRGGLVQEMIREGNRAFGSKDSVEDKQTISELRRRVIGMTEKADRTVASSIGAHTAEVRLSMEKIVASQVNPTPTHSSFTTHTELPTGQPLSPGSRRHS